MSTNISVISSENSHLSSTSSHHFFNYISVNKRAEDLADVNMSLFHDNGKRMTHAAVNTDPLHLTTSIASTGRTHSHYALKERKIPEVKIADTSELHLWYDFGEKLGEGAFGVVLAVVEKNTSKDYAMKAVNKSTSDSRKMKLVEREIQILKLIQHPHIIYLDKVFESSRKIYMIFERCYGELAKIYKERKPFLEQVARNLIRQVAEAVSYLHKHDIVHRDIKLENILMGKNPSDPRDEYYIKLTDFGLSIVKSGKGVDSMLHEYCGTLFYMAPEIVTLRSYSQCCDIWAIGVILYMLIAGKYPFFAENHETLKESICSSDPNFAEITPSPELTDLILLLLTKNPAHRISATEMLNHPWMHNRRMSKAMQYNILQMMKEWKNEMKVPAGKESDWVSGKEPEYGTNASGKQPLNLPKTNINFDRYKKGSIDSRQAESSKDRRQSINAHPSRERRQSLNKQASVARPLTQRPGGRMSNASEFFKPGKL